MSLQVDLSEMPPGVVEEFRKGRVMKEIMTLKNAPELQAEQAKEFSGTNRSINGLGRLRMVVAADAFHYWGRRLGYECWSDKQFLREFERDNESVRVKCGGTRIQTGYRAPYQAGTALKTKYPAKTIIAAGKYSNLTQTC